MYEPNRAEDRRSLMHRGLTLPAVNPVDIRVSGLSVHTKADSLGSILRRKLQGTDAWYHNQILHDVSVIFPSGSLVGILGPSGCGKTTFLNVLYAQRHISGVNVTGEISFTGSRDAESVRSAYLRQDDFLIPSLTVRETLQVAADLRMACTDPTYRSHAVNQLIFELGLTACADTRIGKESGAGCSGGERRRTSLGVQILGNPSCLFCDEPTTGLDAANARRIVRLLKCLSEAGRTVVVSIHTPRPEIWEMFDHILLLSNGHVLYSGPSSSVRQYFEQCGHSIPPSANPAEFLVDLISRESVVGVPPISPIDIVNNLKENWKATESNFPITSERTSNIQPAALHILPTDYSTTVPISRQVAVLTRRYIWTTLRGPMSLFCSLSITIALGIVTGVTFYKLDNTAQGIWSRKGSLFAVLNIYGYPLLVYEIFRLSREIQVFDREREEGAVGVAAFLISRRLARAALEDIPGPVISSVAFYFLVGLWRSTAERIIFLLLMIVATYISLTVAVLAIAISRDFAIAGLIGNGFYTLQSLSGGYLVHVGQISVWLRWSRWITHNFYIYSALCSNEFIGPWSAPQGHLFNCPNAATSLRARCTETYGQDIMASLGFPLDWAWKPVMISVCFLVLYTLVAALILQRNQKWPSITSSHQSSGRTILRAGTELDPLRVTTHVHGVDIKLIRHSLHMTKRGLNILGPGYEQSILKPISATFKRGELSIIMGPSGSGKTSLLNDLTARLPYSFWRCYRREGQIICDSHNLTPSIASSICSYVTQSDHHLQPFLTVRETLLFAARLRLPSRTTKEQRYSKVDSIIRTMGLWSCAETLVGDGYHKGISGGEKRRVSIGIQLLSDPKVLILDEPTSGLDAHTSACILKKLKFLSEEGRTIICSIHQPRSDVFKLFSNILLLAPDGSPVFSGPGGEILRYFRSLGHECNNSSNPSDFIIDLVTVDQQQDCEMQNQTRVQELIENYIATQSMAMQEMPPMTASERRALAKYPNSFRAMFPSALRRSALGLIRQPFLLLSRLVQAPGMTVLFIMFTAPLSDYSTSVQTRIGLLQQLLTLILAGLIQSIVIYPGERDIFKYERQDGCMTATCFIAQYTCLELPAEIMSSVISGAIFTFGAPINQEYTTFLIVSFNMFAIINCGESIGIIILSFFNDICICATLAPILLFINWLCAGLMSTSMPKALQLVAYILPSKYCMANIVPYTMDGLVFICSDEDRQANERCAIQDGKDVLKLYNIDKDAGLNIIGLAACVVVYRLVAYFVIMLR